MSGGVSTAAMTNSRISTYFLVFTRIPEESTPSFVSR